MDEPPILYYRMVDYATRSGDWQYADKWPVPDAENEIYCLHSNGTLSTRFSSHKENSQTYLYDPNQPVPTMGGRNLYIARAQWINGPRSHRIGAMS